jgi:hypothetical protein
MQNFERHVGIKEDGEIIIKRKLRISSLHNDTIFMRLSNFIAGRRGRGRAMHFSGLDTFSFPYGNIL